MGGRAGGYAATHRRGVLCWPKGEGRARRTVRGYGDACAQDSRLVTHGGWLHHCVVSLHSEHWNVPDCNGTFRFGVFGPTLELGSCAWPRHAVGRCYVESLRNEVR